MVWGGLALALDWGRLRTRVGLAATVVAFVSISRLVLGIHYLVDVVVGIGVGVVVLATLHWVSDQETEPDRVLLVAVLFGIVGLGLGVTFDSVAAVGGAVGGWIVWRSVAEMTPAHPEHRREVVAGFAVLGLAGGLFAAIYALEPTYLLTFVGTAVAVGTAIGAPLLGEQLV